MRPPLSRLLERSDEARLHRSWGRIAARRSARPRSRVRFALAAAATIAIALGAAALLREGPRDAIPESPIEGAIAEGARREEPVVGTALPRRVELTGGATIERSAGAELRVVTRTATELALGLERGRVRLAIPPNGPRRWRVITPLGTVRVVGTIFEVEVSDATLEVTVHRGVVEVTSALLDEPRRLHAGESLRVVRTAEAAGARAPEARGEGEPEAIAEAPERVEAGAEDRAEPARAVRASAEPRVLDPVGALLDEADRARREGRPRDAVGPLSSAMQSSDPRAALAAYTLAALERERLERPADAAAHFARAIELGLSPRLERAARAERALALFEAGRAEEARRAAREYIDRHPDGAHRMTPILGSEP